MPRSWVTSAPRPRRPPKPKLYTTVLSVTRAFDSPRALPNFAETRKAVVGPYRGGPERCPCGSYGDATRECRCTSGIIQRYLGKLSGPLLDRIDLHIEVPAVAYRELRDNGEGVSPADMRARVERARAIQQERGFYNAHIPPRSLRRLCALDDAGERMLEMAVRRLGL